LLKSYSPQQFNLKNFPKTIFLHGDKDIDVPIASALDMQSLLNKNSVETKFITLKNFGHIFDILPDNSMDGSPLGLNHPLVGKCFTSIINFL
jgi:dipeptidyl aminopeptidase/acylaminoacyl peptidase